jgi:hypothetical protein
MTNLREALQEVFVHYEEPSTIRANRLIESALRGDVSSIDELMSIAAAHQEDSDIYIDHLARVPGLHLRSWTANSPQRAAELASQMAWHLVSSPWRDRDNEYVGTPLGFIHTVLQSLVTMGHLGEAQDVATRFFTADAHWAHALQRQRTVDWLEGLEPPADRIIAQALNRPEFLSYYTGLKPRSAVLDAVFAPTRS